MTTALYRTFVLVLLTLNSSGALVAGWRFMYDPTGASMGISIEWLQFSPFPDFFIPGLVLFLMNGVYGVVVLLALLLWYSHYPVLVVIQGILLGGWIIIQMILLRTVNFLQTTCLLMAVAFVLLGHLLRIAEYKKKSKPFAKKNRPPTRKSDSTKTTLPNRMTLDSDTSHSD